MRMVAIRKLFSYFLRAGGRVIVFFALAVFLGCHYMDGLSVTMVPDGKTRLNRLAVLPFREIPPENAAFKMVSCPLCGAVFHVDKFSLTPVTAVEDIFLERLHGFSKLTVIAPENAAEAYRRVTASPKASLPLVDILKQTGVELGVDGIIVGYVYRFRERQGNPYSVEKPASVAFDVHLIRVSDGLIVWRASYDKTQSSLMENIIQLSSFYKRKGKWVTARELADEGCTEILKTFPGTW
jgi:hypothetical protein